MPVPSAVEERHPVALAVEAGDPAAAAAAFTADCVLRSPITSRFRFEGRDEIRRLVTALLATLEEWRYTDEFAAGDRHVLVFSARVNGVDLEGVNVLQLDDQGLIREETVWVRPLAGVVALAAGLAPRLAGRGPRALALKLMFTPLLLLVRAGEGVGAALVKGGFRHG